ncbi:alpha/beta fold hydrolase [Allomeiothermus silvanus]|uniref:alpha/beta fold hydrolase n=1 Tax=Allomeiothermus silvanus TaxID=52022 RepID=UPI0023F15D59|nr:alpha/beta hydrolase [Allomeiothermus silvanus]
MEQVVLMPGYLAPPAGFRVLAKALSGFDVSELERFPTAPQAYQEWRARVPRNAHLVAFAEASWAAIHLAAESEARSLSVFGPIVRVDAALEARLRALKTAHATGFAAFVEAAKPWFFGAYFLEHGQEPIAAWAEGLADLDLGQWIGGMLELPDGRKALRLLRCPVLVGIGAEDVFTPSRYAQEVVDWVPANERGLGAVRVSLEGCGHLAPWENPVEAASLVEGFIRGAGSLGGEAPVWDDSRWG